MANRSGFRTVDAVSSVKGRPTDPQRKRRPPGTGRRGRRRARVVAVTIFTACTVLSAGCAHFENADSAPFHPAPSFGAGAEIQPEVPSPANPTPAPPSGQPKPPPPAPCVDPDPNVVATCLNSVGAVVVLPDGSGALVGERRTGRILSVSPGRAPTQIAQIPVDSAGDGGLTALALSPTFDEDQLIYAYVTTPSDNRVVRIAPGDVPKTVFAGIPRGATGNAGAIAFTGKQSLLVLTGNTGDPAAAKDPASLAGKLLRLTALTAGAQASEPPPQQISSGFGAAGGLCVDRSSGAAWVTDRGATQDRLQRVSPDGAAVSTVWTWPDRPGVAGCGASGDLVAIALTDAKEVAVITLDKNTGAVNGTPIPVAQNQYGRLGSADLGPDGTIWVGTVNKSGGDPGPTDDRVVRIPLPKPSGGRD